MQKLKYISLIVCFLFVGQACSDILDNAEPSTATDPSNVLTDPASVTSLRAAMYDNLHDFTYKTRMFLAPDALADNSFVRDGATRFFSLNNNRGTNGVTTGLNEGSYEDVYELIRDANAIINGVTDETFADNPDLLRQYQAEAKTLRAFAMHYLVRVLGYEPGMVPSSGPGAGFNLGIVIRTDFVAFPDEVQSLPRNTVSEVYDQILTDLQQAEETFESLGIVNGSYYEDNPYEYASQSFVQAILARVNLYAGNYQAAYEWADAALQNDGLSLASTENAVARMFEENSLDHPESLLTVSTDPATESLGVNNSLNAYTANQWVAQLPTQSLIDLYPEGDWRLNLFAPCGDEAGGSVSLASCLTVNDQGWEIRKWNAEQGQFADATPLIRVAELKLIEAEAAYRLNGVGAGLVHLNELRLNRGLEELGADELALTDQQANVNPGMDLFIAEILTERRRELAFEGHRFFDLKRLGLNIPDQNGDLKIGYTTYKILDDISTAEINTNPELVQNPGY